MLVFRSVTLSLASMANVSIVVGLFFLIFAIMGVQLFGGRFWSCNDTTVANKVMMKEILLALAVVRCNRVHQALPAHIGETSKTV